MYIVYNTFVHDIRYHYLLIRQVPDHVRLSSHQRENTPLRGPEISPGGREILYYVYQCLFSPGVSERVVGVVLEMTLDLLEDRGTLSTSSSEVLRVFVVPPR